jgi:leucyl aminopeptidase
MLNCFISDRATSLPITLVALSDFPHWLQQQTALVQSWLKTTGFKPEVGAMRMIPNEQQQLTQIICCIADKDAMWSVGQLPTQLPEGSYYLDLPESQYTDYAIAWGLGAYQFARYKKPSRAPAQLYLPQALVQHVNTVVASIYLVRDLINTPTEDMGPTELSLVTAELAKTYGAKFNELVGVKLLKENYPAIHAVGRASDDEPRLIDLRWGNLKHPKVTLVGKGVCFDTGGLDLKPSSAMLLMKKDMGGAAHVLGLARMIMEANLAVCLRVLIPAVENAVAGSAYRPGDVIKSRKGLTIEIGNTDAEGRVILADALTEAVSESPDLLIDMATLTGAARVALGTELPALFANQDEVADAVLKHSQAHMDPLWRLPLFAPYREHMNSQIADINNNSSEPYGGAISAAMFLKEFVPDTTPWLHFDLMAWNTRTKPGRPQGGEAMGLRALFAYLSQRFPEV